MELDNIEKLIEKYLEATTTVAEEKALKVYFAQDEVASHLEQYAPMFRYFSGAKEEQFTQQVALDQIANAAPRRKKANYKWLSVAAVGLLMFGLYFGNIETKLEEEYTQEEIAQAQQALSLLSMNFNKGSQQLAHLKEFEKNTNKFLIK